MSSGGGGSGGQSLVSPVLVKEIEGSTSFSFSGDELQIGRDNAQGTLTVTAQVTESATGETQVRLVFSGLWQTRLKLCDFAGKNVFVRKQSW